jgi:hypothetical protein
LAVFAKKRCFRRGRLSAFAVNWIVGQVRWERVISPIETLFIKTLSFGNESGDSASCSAAITTGIGGNWL